MTDTDLVLSGSMKGAVIGNTKLMSAKNLGSTTLLIAYTKDSKQSTMDSFRKTLLVISVFVVILLLYVGVTQFGYGTQLLEVIPQACKIQTCQCPGDACGAVTAMPKGGQIDMLDEMRAAGLKPQLLSRAVPRPVDNDTSHVVPNVVHYVHYGVANGVPFDFKHYLSFRSASQFLKPQYIFLHGNVVPKGEWWTRTLAEVDNLYHVYRKKQTKICGKKVTFVQHLACFTRLTVTIGESQHKNSYLGI